MYRSKKIEDLIGLVVLLKGSELLALSDAENELCEELNAHLSDYFWSCEGDSWEYTTASSDELDYMDLDEMVEYYNEHKYGELRD